MISADILHRLAALQLTPEVMSEFLSILADVEAEAARHRANEAARTARYRLRGGGKIPETMRTEVFERDHYECVYCGGSEHLQCDHVVPVSRGGETTLENLATACRVCNARKKDRERKAFTRSTEIPRTQNGNRGNSAESPPSPETKVPTPLKTQPPSTQENPPKGGQKKPIPVDDWTAPDLKDFGAEHGLAESDIAREMDTMRDWARGKGERKLDWDAAARNWLRRASETRGSNGHARPNGTGPPRQKSVIALAAEDIRRAKAEAEQREKGHENGEFREFTGPTIDLAAAKAARSR